MNTYIIYRYDIYIYVRVKDTIYDHLSEEFADKPYSIFRQTQIIGLIFWCKLNWLHLTWIFEMQRMGRLTSNLLKSLDALILDVSTEEVVSMWRWTLNEIDHIHHSQVLFGDSGNAFRSWGKTGFGGVHQEQIVEKVQKLEPVMMQAGTKFGHESYPAW